MNGPQNFLFITHKPPMFFPPASYLSLVEFLACRVCFRHSQTHIARSRPRTYKRTTHPEPQSKLLSITLAYCDVLRRDEQKWMPFIVCWCELSMNGRCTHTGARTLPSTQCRNWLKVCVVAVGVASALNGCGNELKYLFSKISIGIREMSLCVIIIAERELSSRIRYISPGTTITQSADDYLIFYSNGLL